MKRTVMKNSLLDIWLLYGLKYKNNSESKNILIDEITPTQTCILFFIIKILPSITIYL